MKTKLLIIIMTIAFVLSIPIPAFAQEDGFDSNEMWFYYNEMFAFSFDIPTDWLQTEEVWVGDEVFQVIMYPDEFSIQSLKDSKESSISDLATGLPFSITAPLISVQYEIITPTKISILNETEVKDYALEKVRLSVPNAEILNSNVESKSWGYVVTIESIFNLDTGTDIELPYHAIDTTYFFNDRECYNVGFGSLEENFEVYRPTYENVLDTLIIKGVVVPEFGGITLLILVSSITSVIIASRKFGIVKL